MTTFDNIEKIAICTHADAIGDIDVDYYHDMLESVIAERIGGEYEYEMSVGTGRGITVTTRDGSDPIEYEEMISPLLELAFTKCCRSEQVPV